MNHSILKHYASAYFSFGKEKNKVETFHEDLLLLSHVFKNESQLAKFLASPMIDKKAKDDLIDNNFKGKVDVATLGFLQVLIKKKAIAYFEEVKQNFEHLYNEDQGILEGRIYTPFELSQPTLEKIIKIFSEPLRYSFDYLLNNISTIWI